jgi:hypothetical protein
VVRPEGRKWFDATLDRHAASADAIAQIACN